VFSDIGKIGRSLSGNTPTFAVILQIDEFVDNVNDGYGPPSAIHSTEEKVLADGYHILTLLRLMSPQSTVCQRQFASPTPPPVCVSANISSTTLLSLDGAPGRSSETCKTHWATDVCLGLLGRPSNAV